MIKENDGDVRSLDKKYSTKDHFALLPCIYVTKMPLYIPLSLKKKPLIQKIKFLIHPPP